MWFYFLFNFLWVDEAKAVGSQPVHFNSELFQVILGVDHGIMFNRRGNDMNLLIQFMKLMKEPK